MGHTHDQAVAEQVAANQPKLTLKLADVKALVRAEEWRQDCEVRLVEGLKNKDPFVSRLKATYDQAEGQLENLMSDLGILELPWDESL